MRMKLIVLTLLIAVLLTFGAQAACDKNSIELSVPSGYRKVDCTYTVYVDGKEVCTGSTGGADKITIPDCGTSSCKVVFSEKGGRNCPTDAPDYTGMKISRKAKKYYGAKPTAAPTAKPTAAPTAKPTAVPTAAPTAKPTAAPTAVPTAKPTAVPTAKPTAAPTAKPTQDPSSGTSSSAMASQVVDLVNEYRAQNGLSPVRVDSDLTAAACVRSKETVASFSHTRPDGSSWSTVSSKARGENIAMGQKTAEKVMAAWMTSEGHRANILRESFTTIGVCAYEVNGVVYWTQLFGTN